MAGEMIKYEILAVLKLRRGDWKKFFCVMCKIVCSDTGNVFGLVCRIAKDFENILTFL